MWSQQRDIQETISSLVWRYVINPNIYKQVSNYFKAFKRDNAFWRANWFVTQLEGVSPFEQEILEDGDTEERTRADGLDDQTLWSHALVDLGTKPISELAVRTEYQTIFKLPSSGCLVFGIHTYIDPLEWQCRRSRPHPKMSYLKISIQSHILNGCDNRNVLGKD